MNGVAAPRRTAETLTAAEVGAHPRAVSVVMVIYFPGEPVKRSLACVLADPSVSELVVVDNGSSVEEAAHLRALAAADRRVVVVSGQGNVGFARASNLGARKAGGERLVFLNPDAFLQPGCIAELVQAIEDRPVPSLVGARVLNADGTEQRGGRLRRGLFPARGGRRPVLARAPPGGCGPVPSRRGGHPPGRHQPDQSAQGGIPQGRRPGPLLPPSGRGRGSAPDSLVALAGDNGRGAATTCHLAIAAEVGGRARVNGPVGGKRGCPAAWLAPLAQSPG